MLVLKMSDPAQIVHGSLLPHPLQRTAERSIERILKIPTIERDAAEIPKKKPLLTIYLPNKKQKNSCSDEL
jgi:hypothetical protein